LWHFAFQQALPLRFFVAQLKTNAKKVKNVQPKVSAIQKPVILLANRIFMNLKNGGDNE